MFAYKLIEIKQKSFFKGHMKLEDLEGKINEHASQGWILDRIVSGETAGSLGFGKDVFILVFKMNQNPPRGGGVYANTKWKEQCVEFKFALDAIYEEIAPLAEYEYQQLYESQKSEADTATLEAIGALSVPLIQIAGLLEVAIAKQATAIASARVAESFGMRFGLTNLKDSFEAPWGDVASGSSSERDAVIQLMQQVFSRAIDAGLSGKGFNIEQFNQKENKFYVR